MPIVSVFYVKQVRKPQDLVLFQNKVRNAH